MRFSYILVSLMLLSITSAQLLQLAGTLKGAAAVGKGVAKLATAVIPAGLLVPLAIVGPLKLSLPILLGLKRLGFRQLKLILAKALTPAPIGIGAGKAGLINSEGKLPKINPVLITASAPDRQFESEAPLLTKVSLESFAYAMPEPDFDETVDGRKSTTTPPAYTPAPPAYPPSPVPYIPLPRAYTPPPHASYRRRRDTSQAASRVETTEDSVIHEAFAFIRDLDVQGCVTQAICDIAVQPTLAKSYGRDIINFISMLDDEKTSPWYPYKEAALMGSRLKSRKTCSNNYQKCKKNTEQLVKEALQQEL